MARKGKLFAGGVGVDIVSRSMSHEASLCLISLIASLVVIGMALPPSVNYCIYL